jgi:hypothetical protein
MLCGGRARFNYLCKRKQMTEKKPPKVSSSTVNFDVNGSWQQVRNYNIRDKVEEEQILHWMTQKRIQHDGIRCQGHADHDFDNTPAGINKQTD